MIALPKLAKLSPRHRMRKSALVLQDIERRLLEEPQEAASSLAVYLRDLAVLLAADAIADPRLAEAAETLRQACLDPESPSSLLRAVDRLRHSLLDATGQAPADWDLIDPRTGVADPESRKVHPGMRVFLEDLRAPFNIGSIFRSADAFGVEQLVLSPDCADPDHPRALRSAMGAVDLVPWKRGELEAVAAESRLPIFALELGGEPIEDFQFPQQGIVLIGSEELGLSGRALDLAQYGRVSIPMSGAKGSLNVAVAFGILMYAWTARLASFFQPEAWL